MFHFHLGFEAFAIAKYRGDGELLVAATVDDRAIVIFEAPVDVDRVAGLGVADIVDCDVVMLAPEEGDRIESLAAAEDIARCSLSLAFGDDTMLDADALAGMWIGPPGDVAGSEHTRGAGLEVLVD